MSGSVPSLPSNEISQFISYLEKKLGDESLATLQREQIAAAISNLESAFDVKECPKPPLTSPTESRRSSTECHNPLCSAVLEESSKHRKNSESENEEAHAAALLRQAIHNNTERLNKKRRSLLEIPRNEKDFFSAISKSSRDDYQILHSSSIMTNLFGTGEDNKNIASFMEGGSRRASEGGNMMDNTIHNFCEQFAKRL